VRVWVDITDAGHVVFLAPIVRRLEDGGHTVTLTARRFAGADTVLRRYGLGGVLTTAHRGGGIGARAVGLVNRTAQLLGSASSGRYAVAAGSHASDFALTAWMLGIPQMTFLDDERLRRSNAVNIRLVDEVAVPEAISPATLAAFGAPAGKLLRYPGFKEEYYLYDVRLSSFSDAIDATQREFDSAGIRIEPAAADGLRLSDLCVEAPRGRALIEHANATILPGERVAITGQAGTGRTMLMRALAGIWPFGRGRIAEPPRERMLFLAQQPYLPIGSLRCAIAYPSAPDAFADEAITAALRDFGLESLVARLDEEEPWDQVLSVQEQQRLALARVLLHQPGWIFLDEATSNLDQETERKAYATLVEKVPRAAVVAVAERPGVLDVLPRRWNLAATAEGRVTLETA